MPTLTNHDENPHHHQSIRLSGYDYSLPGAYFITVCTHQKKCLFGEIIVGEMRLNDYGQIVQGVWNQIPSHFPHVELGESVIMPNHIHGIIVINEPIRSGFTPTHSESYNPGNVNVGAGASPAHHESGQPQGLPLPATLGNIIGAYKSLTSNECLKIFKNNNEFMGKLWQRNYWEHIIRDDVEYHNIILYIKKNPAQWETDKLFIY